MTLEMELKDRIAKCNKILDENPNSQIFAALAEAHRKKGELDKAFRVCQNGLRIHANYGSAHMVMAKINLDKGLYDWAQMEVEKAIEIDGNSHTTDLLLAEIKIYKGEFAHAVKILDRLYKVNNNNQHVNKLLEIARKLPLESPEKVSASRPEKEASISELAPFAETPLENRKPAESKPVEPVGTRDMLVTLSKLPGVEGVLLVNSEGLVAESEWNASQPPDLYGALANEIERAVQSSIESCKFGEYKSILIEADNLIISFVKVRENLLLIKANNNANLGALRLKVSLFIEKVDLSSV